MSRFHQSAASASIDQDDIPILERSNDYNFELPSSYTPRRPQSPNYRRTEPIVFQQEDEDEDSDDDEPLTICPPSSPHIRRSRAPLSRRGSFLMPVAPCATPEPSDDHLTVEIRNAMVAAQLSTVQFLLRSQRTSFASTDGTPDMTDYEDLSTDDDGLVRLEDGNTCWRDSQTLPGPGYRGGQDSLSDDRDRLSHHHRNNATDDLKSLRDYRVSAKSYRTSSWSDEDAGSSTPRQTAETKHELHPLFWNLDHPFKIEPLRVESKGLYADGYPPRPTRAMTANPRGGYIHHEPMTASSNTITSPRLSSDFVHVDFADAMSTSGRRHARFHPAQHHTDHLRVIIPLGNEQSVFEDDESVHGSASSILSCFGFLQRSPAAPAARAEMSEKAPPRQQQRRRCSSRAELVHRIFRWPS